MAKTKAQLQKPECRFCRYHDPSGVCRRYPPVRDRTGDFSWPTVSSGSWCGEFQDRGAALDDMAKTK